MWKGSWGFETRHVQFTRKGNTGWGMGRGIVGRRVVLSRRGAPPTRRNSKGWELTTQGPTSVSLHHPPGPGLKVVTGGLPPRSLPPFLFLKPPTAVLPLLPLLHLYFPPSFPRSPPPPPTQTDSRRRLPRTRQKESEFKQQSNR